MQLPLTIPLSRSRRMIVWLALAHAGALGVLWSLSLPSMFSAALAVSVLASAWLSLRRAWHPHVVAIRIDSSGRIEVESKVGARDTATVLPQTTVLPGLIVLLLRVGRRSEFIPLFTDATGLAAHRQLRLWLRWRVAANASD